MKGQAPAGLQTLAPVEGAAVAPNACACGRHASIYLYARKHSPIPTCSPCAVELIEMGWTPERSELSE